MSVPVGEAGPAAVQEVREPEPPQPGLRVLLIDDDPLQLEMTAAMCRRAGIAAECCQYPEYAAKLVADGRFDLVLTDIQMPSADGFSVLKAVHGVDPALRVVAVSARGELDAADFTARGFAGCLRKPFAYGELLAVVRAACGGAVPAAEEPGVPAAEGEYRRAELRSPDALCNPYLAFALLIRAGMEGIAREAQLPPAVDLNLFTVPEEVRRRYALLPETLAAAKAAAAGSDFIKGNLPESVFKYYVN